jgi:hypothetical protein
MDVWQFAERQEEFAIGLDVGQQIDFSAIAVVARVVAPLNEFDQQHRQKTELRFAVRWLERPQLGTAFSKVVARTVALRNDPAVERKVECYDHGRLTTTVVKPPIVVDATGVGAPLVEMFRKDHKVSPIPVIITGGQELNTARGRYRVPKQDLIAALSVGFELQQVKVASGLDLSDDLMGELKNFRMQTNASTGRSTYDAKPGHHDDLLIAVALAVWWLEEKRRHTAKMNKLILG